MTPGDLLLGWASCYPEHRIARVQAAAQRLRPPPVEYPKDDPRRARYLNQAKRLMWNLQRLAHVERHKPDRFRVVPPAIVSTEQGRHHLVGARDGALIEELRKAMGPSLIRGSQIDAPSVLSFEAGEAKVADIAARLKIAQIRDRGLDVLASLPPLSGLLPGAPPESLPERCERREWESAGNRFGRWTRVSPGTSEPGLYRTIHKPRHWYLVPRDGGPTLRLDTFERRAAAAWSLAGDKVIRHHRESGDLRIPPMPFGLPLLADRALILASGRLPTFDFQQGSIYSRIDPARARQVARVVGARVEETA